MQFDVFSPRVPQIEIHSITTFSLPRECGTKYPFISVFFRETMSNFPDKMIPIGP